MKPSPSPIDVVSIRRGRSEIARHSKSFAMASRLLPPAIRDRASIVYAWCRRADDAIDAPNVDAVKAVARLECEIDQIYGGGGSGDPILAGFAAIVRETEIPRRYPTELVAGMAMDATGYRYETDADLRLYAFRVAGVVGLMMCHVMGLGDRSALAAAARLGIAMQLTNICRDVREDWERGRLYIPATLLREVGGEWIAGHRDGPLPAAARAPLALAVARLLDRADVDYAAGDLGLPALPSSCRVAVGAARRIYAGIGDRLKDRQCDVFAPRAVVSTPRKLLLAAAAAGAALRAAVSPRVYRHALPELAFEEIA